MNSIDDQTTKSSQLRMGFNYTPWKFNHWNRQNHTQERLDGFIRWRVIKQTAGRGSPFSWIIIGGTSVYKWKTRIRKWKLSFHPLIFQEYLR